MSSQSENSFLDVANRDKDLLVATLSRLLRESTSSKLDGLKGKIKEVNKRIDEMNAGRKRLASLREDLEDCLQVLEGCGDVAGVLARMVMSTCAIEVRDSVAEMRPDDLLAEKARLKAKLIKLENRRQAAVSLLQCLGSAEVANGALDHLGKGFKFPLQINSTTGGFAMSDGVDSVKDAIVQIISTVIGSRVMRREFGTSADDALFGPTDSRTLDDLAAQIQQSVLRWEPRLSRVDVYYIVDGPRVDFRVDFQVKNTHEQGSLVYPHYLEDSA